MIRRLEMTCPLCEQKMFSENAAKLLLEGIKAWTMDCPHCRALVGVKTEPDDTLTTYDFYKEVQDAFYKEMQEEIAKYTPVVKNMSREEFLKGVGYADL